MTDAAAFTVVPAIDLRGGRAVRLVEGDFDRETVFSDDPVEVARRFVAAGARRLHLVDLDGARDGAPRHVDVVRAVAALGVPVQVGGGLRDMATLSACLDDAGAHWVILGTVALRDPDLVTAAAARWPGRVLVGVDARGGRVAISGWLETTDAAPADLARAMAARGVAGLVYTDIARDGTGRGPNVEATLEVARAAGVPVLASGGVHDLGHVTALAAHAPLIAGVVVGRALYDGSLDLHAALAVAPPRA